MDNSIAIPPKSLKISEKTCKLNNVPAGSLFYYDGTFALMTEYSTYRDGMSMPKRDAYIVDSGEYFCGGDLTTEERAKLKVHLVTIE